MVRTVLVGQLTTGRRLTQLPVLTAPWSTQLNGPGSLQASIKLDDPRVRARPGLLLAIEPARSFIAVLEGDTVLEAGPIWSHSYSDATKVLTVRGAGIGSVFDYRLVLKTLAAGENPAATSLDYTGSLADIARALVAQALARGSLPIVVGPDEGGTQERTYPGYELARVRQRLDELTAVLGGPDVQFEPRLSADRQGIEWLMRTGTTADPQLHQPGSSSTSQAADWVWDSARPRSGITALDVERDATRMVGRVFSTGQGSTEALMVSVASDDDRVSHGYPLLETSVSHQSVEVAATLDEHAAADLRSRLRPWTTWTLSVRVDRTPLLGTYRPGDFARVWVAGDHPYLSQLLPLGGGQFYRARITGFSGDLKPTIKVALAPQMEAR